MTKQKQRRSSPSEKYILLGLILGGIVLFVLTLGFHSGIRKRQLKEKYQAP